MVQRIPGNNTERKRRIVILTKPSKYDDEGYVIRHFLGVLPGNTPAFLFSLTEDLKRRTVLGPGRCARRI